MLVKSAFEAPTEFSYLNGRIISLEKTVTELVDKIAAIGNHYYRERQEPFKCPVCEGKRRELNIMPNGGYFESECKSCEGKGVLWK